MDTRLIIFDFDGTLADTRRPIVTAMQQTLAEMHLPVPDAAACAATIGLPLEECLRRLIPNPTGELIRAGADIYHPLFEAGRRRMPPVLFPCVMDTLEALHRQDIRMTVASSRTAASLIDLMKHLGIDGLFDYVLGADDVIRAKPNPEPVLKTLQVMNVDASQTLVVGDMAVDILMGARAGCQTCGVTYGNGSARELRKAGANNIIDSMDRLLQIA